MSEDKEIKNEFRDEEDLFSSLEKNPMKFNEQVDTACNDAKKLQEWRQIKYEARIRRELERISFILSGSLIVNNVTISKYDGRTQLGEKFLDISKNYGCGYTVFMNNWYAIEDWHVQYCFAKRNDSALWAPRFALAVKFTKITADDTGYAIIASVADCNIYEAKEIASTVWRLNAVEGFYSKEPKILQDNIDDLFKPYEPVVDIQFSKDGTKKKINVQGIEDLKNLKVRINGKLYSFDKMLNVDPADVYMVGVSFQFKAKDEE